MIIRLSLALIAAGVSCYATADLGAQSNTPTGAQIAALTPTPHVIATPLVVPRAAIAPARFRITASRPGDTARVEIGVETIERHDLMVTGAPAIQRVVTFTSRRGNIVDSTVCHAESLAPVSEISHQPTREMRLEFRGAHVTGTVAPKDSAAHAVDMDTTVPGFNSSDADLVVTSLPLAPGYKAILPFYTYELGGLERDTVTVLRAEKFTGPDGQRTAWVAQLADPFVHITFWIDSGTRQILQEEIARRKDGMVMRLAQF